MIIYVCCLVGATLSDMRSLDCASDNRPNVIRSWNCQTALSFKLAPVVRGKRYHRKLLSSLAAEGPYSHQWWVRNSATSIELDKNQTHTIEVVVDRLIKKPGLEERLTDSLSLLRAV